MTLKIDLSNPTTDQHHSILCWILLLLPLSVCAQEPLSLPLDLLAPKATTHKAKALQPQEQALPEVCITELLPPRKGEVCPFVELLNLDNAPHFVSEYALAIIEPQSHKTLSITPLASTSYAYCLAPKEYVALTTHPRELAQNYPTAWDRVCTIERLPSFPPGDLLVALIRQRDGAVLEEIALNAQMRVRPTAKERARSIERINPYSDGKQPTNWALASLSAERGTPGRRNSVYQTEDTPFWNREEKENDARISLYQLVQIVEAKAVRGEIQEILLSLYTIGGSVLMVWNNPEDIIAWLDALGEGKRLTPWTTREKALIVSVALLTQDGHLEHLSSIVTQ